MTPDMVTELKKLNKILKRSKTTDNKLIDWVGHGSDIRSEIHGSGGTNIENPNFFVIPCA